ncbi:hypothetical protein ACFFX0_10740 [Citricoccus parietis]|uniref:Uncharacterized protein n=1 Tax=Citricoccus parietis TaxID=592307 RepID=A0ABV5FYC1_9MICC
MRTGVRPGPKASRRRPGLSRPCNQATRGYSESGKGHAQRRSILPCPRSRGKAAGNQGKSIGGNQGESGKEVWRATPQMADRGLSSTDSQKPFSASAGCDRMDSFEHMFPCCGAENQQKPPPPAAGNRYGKARRGKQDSGEIK